jgi:hypothetical protein
MGSCHELYGNNIQKVFSGGILKRIFEDIKRIFCFGLNVERSPPRNRHTKTSVDGLHAACDEYVQGCHAFPGCVSELPPIAKRLFYNPLYWRK